MKAQKEKIWCYSPSKQQKDEPSEIQSKILFKTNSTTRHFSTVIRKLILSFEAISLTIFCVILFMVFSIFMDREFERDLILKKAQIAALIQTKYNALSSELNAMAQNTSLLNAMETGDQLEIQRIIRDQYAYANGALFCVKTKNETIIPDPAFILGNSEYHCDDCCSNIMKDTIPIIRYANNRLIGIYCFNLKHSTHYIGKVYVFYDIARDKNFWSQAFPGYDGTLYFQEKQDLYDLQTQAAVSDDNIHRDGPNLTIASMPATPIDLYPGLYLAYSNNHIVIEKIRLTTLLLIIFGTLILLSLLLARRITSEVNKPLERMAQQAHTIAHNPTTKLATSDLLYTEFKQLAESFNHVLQRLTNTQKELLEQASELNTLNQDLEERVTCRTEELAQAIQYLQQEVAVRTEAEEKAEAASQSKSVFLANMSHELRTPMNAVLGFTELVLNSELTPVQRKRLQIARNRGEDLLHLLNDILDYSRIEARKMKLNRQTVDLPALFEEAMQSITPQLQSRNLASEWTIDHRLPHTILTDPDRLKQIMTNLLSNAVKFSEKGRIALHAEPAEEYHGDHVLDSDTGDIYLHISVSDNGIGIPAEKQKDIFNLFSQADGSTTRKYGGTGLGLAICKRLTEMMSGRIWVESKEGIGSTFHFIIKTTASQQKHKTPSTPPSNKPESSTSLRVLVAEDDETNRLFLMSLLESLDYCVKVAENGEEAFKLYQQEPFDLILMDVWMPVRDGIETTRMIRKEEQSSETHTPIIAITADVFDDVKSQCHHAGMDAHISKPVNKKTLVQVINRLMQQQT